MIDCSNSSPLLNILLLHVLASIADDADLVVSDMIIVILKVLVYGTYVSCLVPEVPVLYLYCTFVGMVVEVEVLEVVELAELVVEFLMLG